MGARIMRKAIYVGISMSVAFAGGMSLRRPSAPAPAPAAAADPEPGHGHDEEIASLRRDLASLRLEVARLAAAAAAPAAPAGGHPSLLPPAPVSAEERAAATASTTAQMQAHVAARYSAERPDPLWSAAAEDGMSRALAEAGLAPLFRRIECGATLCRLSLQDTVESPPDDLAERLTDLAPFQTQLLFDTTSRSGGGTVYGARPGHDLPLGS